MLANIDSAFKGFLLIYLKIFIIIILFQGFS